MSVELPKEWEAIRQTVLAECNAKPADLNIVDIKMAVSDAVERCYALTQKPQRELTDAEIDEIYDGMPGGPNKFVIEWGFRTFARKIEQAHQRKQREPETVKVKVRSWRYTENAQINVMSEQCGDISKATPWDYGNTFWLGPAQEIEVTLP